MEPDIDQAKNLGFIKIGFRPEFLKTPIIYGRKRIIILANTEKHNAQYAIVELNNILASHNEYSFADTPGYPQNTRGENINDRNYSGDINAQAKVIDIAQNFEPETQISTSTTAAGLPVITVDGIVVSGNNRTMSFKRMINDFPDNYKEYLKILQTEIVSFGFDQHIGTALILKENIPLPGSSFNNSLTVKFQQPILVRIDYSFPAYTTTEMNKYNKDTRKAERPIDRAIKLSSMLLDNERAVNIISDILLPYETLSEFYGNATDVKRLKQALTDNNILTTQETPNYFTEVNTLTVNGKEFLLNLLAAMILDKDALLSSEAEGVKRLKEKLVAALPAVIKNIHLPEGSLNEINQAIILQQKMVASGMTISDFIRSPKLFGSDVFQKNAYFINELLNATKFAFKGALELYNKAILNNQGPSMFGEKMTTEQIFRKTMADKLDSDIVNLIDKFYKPEPNEPEKHKEQREQGKQKEQLNKQSAINILKQKLAELNELKEQGKLKEQIILSQGGNITPLQQNAIDTVYATYNEEYKQKHTQLLRAKAEKNKAYNEYNQRCGLFGDTKADPRQKELFHTELVCTSETLATHLQPHEAKIKLIEKELQVLSQNLEHQVNAILKQSEIEFMAQGGNAGCDKGCHVAGRKHPEGGENFKIKETGQMAQLEAGEAVIKADAVASNKYYEFEGQKMTPAQILNKINTDFGGNPITKMHDGGNIQYEYKPQMPYSIIEEPVTNEELQIYEKVKLEAVAKLKNKLKVIINEKSEPPYGEIFANYIPSQLVDYKYKISQPGDINEYLRARIDKNSLALQEMCWVIFLNNQSNILGFSLISKGGVSHAVFDPKLILGLSLKTLATRIILAHNHPTGNANPSEADKKFTQNISQACKYHEIELLDHLILSGINSEYFSFKNSGLL